MVGMANDQANKDPLWDAFNAINSYYTKELSTKNSPKTTLLIVRCMLNLLAQLPNSPAETKYLQTAYAYWLEGDKSLESTLFTLNKEVESQITYRSLGQENKLSCITQVLSIDKDHFDDFPEFLEDIHLAGLPTDVILDTVKNDFNYISALLHVAA